MLSPTFKRFMRYAVPYWRFILVAIVSGLLKFTLALSLVAALKLVVDYVLVAELARDESNRRLLLVLIGLIIAFAGRVPFAYLRSYCAQVAGNRTIFDIRRDLFRHIQRLSLAYHNEKRTGGTISRLINDLNAAQGILDRGVIAVTMDIMFLGGTIVFLFAYDLIKLEDWSLALVSLWSLPIYGIVFAFINPRLRIAAGEVQEEMEEMSGEATEKIAGLPVVQAFVREKTEELNFFHRNRRYYDKLLRRIRLRLTLQTTAEFLTGVGPVVVISYGAYMVLEMHMSIGDLLLFNGLLAHLYLPTRRLADYSAQLQENLAAMDRVFEVFDTVPEIQDRDDAVLLEKPEGRVEFDDVHFAYNVDQTVLRGIGFTIEPGQAVAIVGRSGAGKSTLASLLPRFYDVNGGTIRIDGHDVRKVTLRSLRENIGMVLQDTILFSGTIRDNILYGRLNATEEEMLEAAQMAHVDEFVQEMPDDYDTIIGERGVMLSGGQKQRLSIARAFLRDPRILILDEATSNLDSGAEQIIQDALRELMRGRTTLVIAHRLSTIVDCDFVVVLKDGRVVQRGSHSELIRVKGPYRRFCREQFGEVELDDLSQHAV
jgi:ATP-binding cassette, subfamily B, putative efflux pump